MLIEDLRYAVRTLRARPLSAAVAVMSLALGIGVNTAVFTIADQVLLRSLPVREPARLVNVDGGELPPIPSTGSSVTATRCSRPGLLQLGPQSSQCGWAAAKPQVVTARMVSGNFFGTLGVGAAVGRTIQESDDQAPGASPVAVLSYGFWNRRFARDPSVLGSRVNINGYPLQVVGVLEPGFDGIEPGVETDVYIPIHMTRAGVPLVRAMDGRHPGWHWLSRDGPVEARVSR